MNDQNPPVFHRRGCSRAIPARTEASGSGSIINISSRVGIVGISGAVAFASSKPVVRQQIKSVALYSVEQRLAVRCNSIHPAAILTPMWEPLLGDGPDRARRMAEFVVDIL